MKNKTLSLILLCVLLFVSACANPATKAPMNTGLPSESETDSKDAEQTDAKTPEEGEMMNEDEASEMADFEPEASIIYENTVVETIDKQLNGLPMDAIRAKANLIMEKSVADIQNAIQKGDLNYTELVAFYLDRIKTYDKSPEGINAVIEINPNAIAEAQKLDESKIESTNPIYGMPVLVKDNINTKDLPTSGGTVAFKDFRPTENATVIENLVKNNAIILGKANLSELAHFFDFNMPMGYSARIGQTRNPFGPGMISPMGSSSGSGAAVAANFAPLALGTETSGSIMAPSAIHSIVGFRPTKDMISTEGVLPLSSTLDAVGPMAKTVADAVVLYNAAVQDPKNQIELTTQAGDIANKRIGVFKDEESAALVDALKKLGAIPIEIDLKLNAESMNDEFVMLQDFAKDFAAYAQKYNTPIKNLADLVTFNQEDLARRAKYGQGMVEEAVKVTDLDEAKVQKIVSETQSYLQGLFKEHQLDAIAFVNSNFANLPCIAGYPEMTVPQGKSEWGDPKGATFMGLGGEDAKLVNLAYAFEQATQARLIPELYLENK